MGFVQNSNRDVFRQFVDKRAAANRHRTLVTDGEVLTTQNGSIVLARWSGEELEVLQVLHPWVAGRVQDFRRFTELCGLGITNLN